MNTENEKAVRDTLMLAAWEAYVARYGAPDQSVYNTIASRYFASPPQQQEQIGEVFALPFAILDDEMEALRRFHECVTDGEGYDVPKPMMKRLAEIGLLRHVSAGYYEQTIFGLAVLNGDFSPTTPTATASQNPEADITKDECRAIVRRVLDEAKGEVK